MSTDNYTPQRIVCLSAEAVDVLFRIGAGERVVGVSAYAQVPAEFQAVPRISGFNAANIEAIRRLQPDLVITYSDVQANLAAELVRAGLMVLATNQRTLQEIAETMEMIGRVVDCEDAAKKLVGAFRAGLGSNKNRSDRLYRKPKVYFEEWHEPLISGICWVSELIEIAGGEDSFAEFRSCRKAAERVVSPEEVVRRNPDLIVASWCGKKADLAAIQSRPGWSEINAVRLGQVYEMDSSLILQPGPRVLDGLEELKRLIERAR